MKVPFISYGIELLIDGSRLCPVLPTKPSAQQMENTRMEKRCKNSKSNSVCIKQISRRTSTDTNAKEIWDKLCARLERSST